LLGNQSAADVCTPERLTDEHRLVGRTVATFLNEEVLPLAGRLEEQDWTLARKLMRRCGDLGLLGTAEPGSTLRRRCS
jgi:hypothetical protein